MRDVAIDPPIPAHFLRADLALPGQPADVFRMEAGKFRYLGGDAVWQVPVRLAPQIGRPHYPDSFFCA